MNSALPTVSIVIPSYSRPKDLVRCLESLAMQTDAALEPVEVIVVDDGSPEPLSIQSENWRRYFTLRLIRQGNAGPAIARNHGAKMARGEILVFTDDDCMPTKGWLEALVSEIKSHPEALVGTGTFNGLSDDIMASTSQFILELVYEHFNALPERAYFLASNNMACRREHYLGICGFDENFPRPGAEDRDFCDRWRMSGRTLRLIPHPLLEHRHPQTLGKFLDLHFRYGSGAFLYQAKRRARASGTMKEDLQFHRSLVQQLWKRLPQQGGFIRQTKLLLGLLLWQIANAAGFFWARGQSLSFTLGGSEGGKGPR